MTDEMKRGYIYNVVANVQMEEQGIVDGFADDVTDSIIEYNGLDLNEDEIREIAADFFNEEEDEDDGE